MSDYVIHSESEINSIRKAALAAARVRDQLPLMAVAGMSTGALDELAGRLIADTGGKSAFFGYHGFPGQICISLNDEVVHGIGSPQRIMHNGDIVSIDVGVAIDGGIGDTALTFPIGEIPENIQHLIKYTRQSLFDGIEKARCGNYIRDISCAIEKTAKRAKLGIVREYVGHGCGTKLHEAPEIPNFRCAWRGPKLRPGMVLAIEPMLNAGSHKVFTDRDRWTVRSRDGSFSAHFEHMVLITENNPEILTWQKM